MTIDGALKRAARRKRFSYVPIEGGVLEVWAELDNRCDDGCTCGGFILECDNGLTTNLVDWTAIGSNDETFDPNSQYGSVCESYGDFVLKHGVSDALKIWPSNGANYARFKAIPRGKLFSLKGSLTFTDDDFYLLLVPYCCFFS